jgi:hypothetical protein
VVILEKLEQSKSITTPKPQPAYETPEERELRKINEQIIRDRAAAQAGSPTSNALGGFNPNKMLEAIQKTSGPDIKTTYNSGTGKYTVTAFGTTTEKTPEEMAKLAELNMDDFKSLAATTDATIQTGAADVKQIGAITKATAPTDITAAATAQQKGTAVVTGEPALGVPEGFSTKPKPGKPYSQEMPPLGMMFIYDNETGDRKTVSKPEQ